MPDEDNKNNSEGNIEATFNAVTGLVKAVPVYQDAVQPAAKEVGKTLETIAKTVNVALAPVSALVWCYDQIKDFVDNKVSEKLQNVPSDKIVTPPTHIAGPALESLRYTGSIDELKELYANLIASSMDKDSTKEAHPSFVEIIKQLSPDEAKLLSVFIATNQKPVINIRNNRADGSGGRDHYRFFTDFGERYNLQEINLVPNYLDNLSRLGLIVIPGRYALLGDDMYTSLEEHQLVKDMIETIDNTDDRKSEIVKTAIKVTGLGRQFIRTCVQDHRSARKIIN